MLPQTSSSTSDGTDRSSESLLSRCNLGPQARGLPDIFVDTNAMTRALRYLKPQQSNEDMCIQLDAVDYICRICHGGNSSGDLLTPCRCKGTIALAHMKCLEIWLNESNRNECELCQYHFRIIRTPRYGIVWSIFVFLRHPGEHLRELLVDTITFVVYTPSTVTSSYMLMLLCESMAKTTTPLRRSFLSHVMAFTAIFAINFIYTSWLVLTVEKYVDYWRDWYKRHCTLKVILSANKLNQNPFRSVDSNLPAGSQGVSLLE